MTQFSVPDMNCNHCKATIEKALFAKISESMKPFSTHLSKLEEAGYVAVKKTFQAKRPLTTCSLTERGRAAFEGYLKALESYFPARRP